MKIKKLSLVFSAVVLVLFTVLGIVLLVVGTQDEIADLEGVPYSSEELGLPDVTNAFLSESVHWFETANNESWVGPRGVSAEKFVALRGHERERIFFEFQLDLVLSDALETLEGDLDHYRGILATSYTATLDDCLVEKGFLGGVAQLDDLLAEARRQQPVGATPSPTRGHHFVVQAECAELAATFPNLDSIDRDGLLRRTRRHLFDALSRWLIDNPDVAIPVDFRPGAPQPFAESLIETCIDSSDPELCAAEAGVTLPSE